MLIPLEDLPGLNNLPEIRSFFHSPGRSMNHWVTVPLALIVEDSGYPDRDTRLIYDHLKYALSRPSPFPLPAIRAVLVDGRITITAGHKYFQIARELQRPWIRTILTSEAQSADLLSSLPSGIEKVPREELEREVSMPVVRGSHVYFFDEPLSAEAQRRFLSDIAGFFERLDTPLIDAKDKRLLSWAFPFGAKCAEFEALVPVGDPRWNLDYLAACTRFSQEVQRIVSFQGDKFPG